MERKKKRGTKKTARIVSKVVTRKAPAVRPVQKNLRPEGSPGNQLHAKKATMIKEEIMVTISSEIFCMGPRILLAFQLDVMPPLPGK